MEIIFTKHANEKFEILKKYSAFIARQKVIEILEHPEQRDYSRNPLIIAQGTLNQSHVVRIVYRIDQGKIVIITFYPGRKSQYEKN